MAAGERKRGQGFWLTAGEIVGVLALIIAGLNLWESHQQRVDESRRAESSQRAQTAFVAVGQADRDGSHLAIAPLKSAQAIESQTYAFPSNIQGAPKEISAARPQIDVAWVAQGLRAALEDAKVKGAGQGYLPVLITTTYVEDGDQRTDVSLYRIGWAWRPKLFGGEQIRLRGLALVRRNVIGDPRAALQARWAADRPRP